MCNAFRRCGLQGRRCRLSAFVVLSPLVLLFIPFAAQADPCLIVYPDIPCVYHYDVTEYYTVEPGHPLYDPLYDRGGEVLLLIGTDEIDESIYQAPNLAGFEPSVSGNDGFIFTGTGFGLIIDGFSKQPTVFENILVVFDQFEPPSCTPFIWVNGELLDGCVYGAGDLEVSTPTASGNNYSDTMTIDIEWRGCYGIHIWAFADENYNGIRDGGECFTAFSHDAMVPVETKTWGVIKTLYR